MKNGQAHNSSNKLEIDKMLGVDARMRIDLESVIVMGRVLEQTIERIKHFMG